MPLHFLMLETARLEYAEPAAIAGAKPEYREAERVRPDQFPIILFRRCQQLFDFQDRGWESTSGISIFLVASTVGTASLELAHSGM